MARLGARALASLGVSGLIIASAAACSAPPLVDVTDESAEGDEPLNELAGGRFDAAYGDRIANKALRVNGRGSGGRCLAEVQNSLEMAGVKSMPRLPGAVDLDNWLMAQGDAKLAHWGFQKQARAIGDIPRGSIVAWRPGQCGYHRTYGHIEIAVGGGRACSDFCGSIKTTCGAPNIYVPVGFGPERCGTGTTIGAIDAKYQSLGGCRSFLGAPTTNELTTADAVGRYNLFTKGAIYWTPSAGAFEVHGLIYDKWRDLGSETSLLGYPTTDETKSPDGRGRSSEFQHGSIYWSAASGAHEVHGPIHDKWNQLGSESGFLGSPLSDVLTNVDGFGQHSDFANGSIYWSQDTGAHEVRGKILEAWKSITAEIGVFGYPTSDEYDVPGGRKSDFEGGAIRLDSATGQTFIEKDPNR